MKTEFDLSVLGFGAKIRIEIARKSQEVLPETERARFLLDQAEKSLMATLADAQALGQNAIYIAGVYIAALGACGAMLMQRDHSLPLQLASFLSGIFLTRSAALFISSALAARGIQHPGNLAEQLDSSPYKELPTSLLIELEAKSHDARIKENAERNETTGRGINRGMRDLIAFPVILLFAWTLGEITLAVVASQ